MTRRWSSPRSARRCAPTRSAAAIASTASRLAIAPTASRGQALLPWPNRIRDGAYEWRGAREQLPIDEVALHNAIHGLVRWRNWALRERSPERVGLGLRLHPQPGYPFTLDLTIAYELGEGGLRVVTSAENVGAEACPFGAGFHPYLTLGGPVDRLRLTLPGAAVLVADERMIPTDVAAVAGASSTSGAGARSARPCSTPALWISRPIRTGAYA